MERFMSGVVAVLWCLGMLLCTYGYHTEKMLSFGFWGTLIVLSTAGVSGNLKLL